MTNKVSAVDVVLLVASDSSGNAALVQKLLDSEYPNIHTSVDVERVVDDFEKHHPDVLVLAFDTLEKAERYYLGLYRLSDKIHQYPHRTIILCSKEELTRVYQLCVKEYFDDYVLFWPMPYDATRLPMAVRHVLRDLAAHQGDEPSAAEFAAQARRLAELESLLETQIAHGGRRIEGAGRAMAEAELGVGAALEDFSRRLADGTLPDIIEVKSVAGLEREIGLLKRHEIGRHFRDAAASVRPLTQWATELKRDCGPYLESARTLNVMAGRVRQTILVVDDDEFQRKIIARMLDGEPYRVEFASGGLEAMSVLRRFRPDLILMDVMMPDVDGIEATRRLKEVPQFANLQVVIMTGRSEKSVVIESRSVGAIDFVVKPFERDTLLAKITKALRAGAAAPDPAP